VLYLLLCRILQLVVLFGRGDRAEEIEIVVLRRQVVVLRRQVDRPGLNDGDRVLLTALSRLAVSVIVEQFLCHLGDVASLAPSSGHPQVDLRAHASRRSFNLEGHR
jgi:hypothetical protein